MVQTTTVRSVPTAARRAPGAGAPPRPPELPRPAAPAASRPGTPRRRRGAWGALRRALAELLGVLEQHWSTMLMWRL
ncbi:hypothetical protein ICW40_08120 [Actinotalea ferrariae]|uniref:hypothetical protein n=1 Tax=Actinotalea ferrariae TaxID=1386098 RepID=UPI001C8C9C5D|nr:hypothetical protein [Actinotalea ferrariae]MBX9244775.1 hypothetical protein [Actinotalea ferrariae]